MHPPLSLESLPSFSKLIHDSVYSRLIDLLAQDHRHLISMQLIHSIHAHGLHAAFPDNVPDHYQQVFARFYLTAHFIRISLSNLLKLPRDNPLSPFERQSASNMVQWIRLKLDTIQTDLQLPGDDTNWGNLAEDVSALWYVSMPFPWFY